MKLYCYHTPPIDFWFGALTQKQLLDSMLTDTRDWEVIARDCNKVGALEKKAREAFATIGWEGDVREGPFYFAILRDSDMALGYIVKQENNGNCFIASPEALPYLDQDAFDQAVV